MTPQAPPETRFADRTLIGHDVLLPRHLLKPAQRPSWCAVGTPAAKDKGAKSRGLPGPHKPKPVAGVPIARDVVVANGGTRVPSAVAETPAPQHAAVLPLAAVVRGRPFGIRGRVSGVGSVPIVHPLPDVPLHVVQAPGV